MSPERWQRVKGLFFTALERQATERTQFLDRACGADAELRAEVEGLLASHDAEPDFIEQPALATVSGAVECRGNGGVPRGGILGNYRLVRVIGSGGMGTVYQATQLHPHRTVALKVMRLGLATPAATRRFEYEAEILGRLHHPGIAHVYEAGIYDDQAVRVPYFAMEYVADARTLCEYAAGRQLDTIARLELFAQVCDAVHHAHQVGIIHRDLKPANILVDGTGRPKVIDFGVARIADPQLSLMTAATRAGDVVGTLQYMSPELLSGDPAATDTRSDVYALGVVLFELLSGKLPYDLSGVPVSAVVADLSRYEPRRLGTVCGSLRGDLEVMAAKALEKDKCLRYTSAAELAADIRRYLDHEPILARAPSTLYQLGRFIRRRRGLVSAIAAILVISLFGFCVSTVLFLREQAARGAAVFQADRARTEASAAESARREAEFQAYAGNLAAAGLALRAYDVADARRRLERAPEHLRDWEWHHFMRRLDRSRRTFRFDTQRLRSFALSPDGAQIAAGDYDGRVYLWDIHADREVGRLNGRAGAINGVAYSSDGALIATATAHSTCKVWDARTRKEIATLVSKGVKEPVQLPGGTPYANSVTFSPDDALLLVSMWDGTIRIWRVATHEEWMVLDAHTDQVMSVVFSPDGTLAASASWDGTAKLWDAAGWKEIRTFTGHSGLVYDVCFSPDGTKLATASEDTTVRLWDVSSGAELRNLHGHSTIVNSVAFTGDGQHVVSSSSDSTVRVWDLDRSDHRVLLGHESVVIDTLCDPYGQWIASVSNDGTVKLWDVDTSDVRTLLGHESWVWNMDLSPDGRWIASAGGGVFPRIDKSVRLWDVATGAPLHVLRGHSAGIYVVAFSPAGDLLASGSADQSIILWDVASGRELTRLSDLGANVWGLRFSSDGRRLVSAYFDGSLRLWRIVPFAETGELISVRAHEAAIRCLAQSPDGKVLATASEDRTVKLWDSAALDSIATLSDSESYFVSAAFSPDGRWLAAGCFDGRWIVWDLRTGEPAAKRRGHTHAAFAVAFSPDSARLATGSGDRTIKLWDVGRWDEVATLHGHTSSVSAVEFTPDGRYLVSASRDLSVRLWDAW